MSVFQNQENRSKTALILFAFIRSHIWREALCYNKLLETPEELPYVHASVFLRAFIPF